VELLRVGGAVFVGKSYTVEFASGGLLNPQYRSNPDGSAVVTPNPWNVKHQPGGSSSGTASAVAGGQVLAGTGSCTGGSIRGPSAYCNLSGIKPTYGLVSKRGVMPLSKTLDHAGPMCRTAQDCAMFLDAMKGYDPKAAGYDSLLAPNPDEVIAESLDGSVPMSTTVVIIPSMLRGCDPEVLENFHSALSMLGELGCTLTELEPLAGFDMNDYAAARKLSGIEKAAYIKDMLIQRPVCNRYDASKHQSDTVESD
jgi:aspartyl-tRNA(Asn)/glutamyl-tRNA(Gln) amidotransferase subunit A